MRIAFLGDSLTEGVSRAPRTSACCGTLVPSTSCSTTVAGATRSPTSTPACSDRLRSERPRRHLDRHQRRRHGAMDVLGHRGIRAGDVGGGARPARRRLPPPARARVSSARRVRSASRPSSRTNSTRRGRAASPTSARSWRAPRRRSREPACSTSPRPSPRRARPPRRRSASRSTASISRRQGRRSSPRR